MSRGPVSLFHAATEREKEEAAKRHHVEMIKRGQVNIFEVKQQNKEADAVLEQVISRLKAEMDAKQSNAYVQCVGQQMIDFLNNNSGIAEQMTDETKTLEGSYRAVEQFAMSQRNRTAMITPQQTFEAIMTYYGIVGAVLTMPTVSLPISSDAPIKQTIEEASTPLVAEPVVQEQPKKRFNASMDDFW